MVTCERKSQLEQHIATAKHQQNITSNSSSGAKRQCLLQSSFQSAAQQESKRIKFNTDLCNMMVEADIPLHKLNAPIVKQFLQTYTIFSVPDESTIRKNYLPGRYSDIIKTIQANLHGKFLFIIVDETTDRKKRSVANFLIGELNSGEGVRPFLTNVTELDKVNHSCIVSFVIDSFAQLFPSTQDERNRVLLLVSDAAAYMTKAAIALKDLFPKLIHITCLAHGISRVAECIRGEFTDVDRLIANGKKVFLKSPARIRELKIAYPTVPVPPEPIITRWGTWIQAATYYAHYFNKFKQVVSSFNPEDAASIRICQELLNSDTVLCDLTFIKANFGNLPKAIKQREGSGLSLDCGIAIVNSALQPLQSLFGDIGAKVAQKVAYVLEKNAGYTTLMKLNAIISGSKEKVEDYDFTPHKISSFKFAPITSCDVERTFSVYKRILTDRRTNVTMEHLKMHLVIHCFSTNAAKQLSKSDSESSNDSDNENSIVN